MLGLGFQPQIEALRALLLPPSGAAGEGEEGGKAAKKKRRVQVGRAAARAGAGMAAHALQPGVTFQLAGMSQQGRFCALPSITVWV